MTTNTGWLCPRCHLVNAPHVDRCACVPDALSPYVPLRGATGAPMRCATCGGPFWVCHGSHTVASTKGAST